MCTSANLLKSELRDQNGSGIQNTRVAEPNPVESQLFRGTPARAGPKLSVK